MTPGEFLAQEVREWLAKAEDDLAGARILHLNQHDELALYHCQQSAEKALKAWLCANQRTFRKTHDLRELGALCVEIDESLQAEVEAAQPLSDFAWKLRYPGAPYAISEGETDDMITRAARLLTAIRERWARTPEPEAETGPTDPAGSE